MYNNLSYTTYNSAENFMVGLQGQTLLQNVSQLASDLSNLRWLFPLLAQNSLNQQLNLNSVTHNLMRSNCVDFPISSNQNMLMNSVVTALTNTLAVQSLTFGSETSQNSVLTNVGKEVNKIGRTFSELRQQESDIHSNFDEKSKLLDLKPDIAHTSEIHTTISGEVRGERSHSAKDSDLSDHIASQSDEKSNDLKMIGSYDAEIQNGIIFNIRR